VVVRSTTGSQNGTATATSAGKPLTVDGSQTSWGTSCYWDTLGTNRPYHESFYNPCIDSGPERYAGTMGNGSTQRAVCWQRSFQITNSQGVSDDVWVRLENGGLAPSLYFTSYGSVPTDLPTC
jgi:hypothetical protein